MTSKPLGPDAPDEGGNTRDWTDALPPTAHVSFFRSVDWAATPLGAVQGWGAALRMYTHMVMADSRAATIYWGPGRIAIYNASFVPLAAGAHPQLMGQGFSFGFPELDPFIGPLFDEGTRSGAAQDVVDAPMMVERNGYREEAFFTGNFTPVRGVDGDIEGFYNALFEVTSQKIVDRRKNMLNLLASPTDLSMDGVYAHIMESMATNPLDIPMAVMYHADTGAEPGSTLLCDLDGTTGIVALCRRATVDMVFTPPDERFAGVEWRGFGQAPENVATAALASDTKLFGFLALGTNPYRPFDEACVEYLKSVTRTASSMLASAWAAEILREKQEQLQSDLEFSDMKVRHLVEHASVGMAHAKPDGSLLWANDKFLSLASPSSETDKNVDSIFEVFINDDQQTVQEVWSKICSGESHVSAELRLKQLFKPPVGDPEPAQVQILAFPFREHGITVSGMACVTDISRLKWAEQWQFRLAQDARNAKRQQEDISLSFDDLRVREDISNVPDSILDVFAANASAASVILDCCKHQKRIIDDILTLSRLESTLLSLKPTAIRPSELVTSIFAMFEAELQLKAIHTEAIAEPSINELNIDYLNLDSSRVTQVFINLLTNAMKFMKDDRKKNITVRYGTTLLLPQSDGSTPLFPEEVHWAPSGRSASDPTNDSEWGTGEAVYLMFSVADNGIGMRPDEIGKIFERFRQANVMTHATYGGSGLGLFISKELTERMGGEIGVVSEPDKGSQFVFYIKTRRVDNRLPSSPLPLRSLSDDIVPLSSHDKLRVLLVEDNLINQRVLRKHLSRYDCEVQVANHGVEALDMVCSLGAHFDVVLMDIQMPIMDGLTCTRKIRELEKTGTLKGKIPIIAVTANVRHEQIQTAMAAGANRVVQKPFKAADLVVSMRDLVNGVADEDIRLNSIAPM